MSLLWEATIHRDCETVDSREWLPNGRLRLVGSIDFFQIMVSSNDSYFIFNVAINSAQNPSSFVSIPKVAIVENH
jgi:hypothetical protein